jgi:hypothetical protein
VLSALTAVVFNAVHPRASAASLNDTTELLRIVSVSDSWRVVHLASMVAILVGAGAIVVILWSMVLHGSKRWPFIALVALVLTTPVLLLSVGLDGFAIKSIADRWAHSAGADRQMLVTAATALRSVDVAVLDIVMVGHFGLTAIMLGIASATTTLYGRWLGLVAVAGGGMGVVCGVLQALSGRLTTLSYLVLLSASLALFTVWLAIASYLLLRRADAVVSRPPRNTLGRT